MANTLDQSKSLAAPAFCPTSPLWCSDASARLLAVTDRQLHESGRLSKCRTWLISGHLHSLPTHSAAVCFYISSDLQQGDLLRETNTDSAFVRTGSSSSRSATSTDRISLGVGFLAFPASARAGHRAWRVGSPADHVAELRFLKLTDRHQYMQVIPFG